MDYGEGAVGLQSCGAAELDAGLKGEGGGGRGEGVLRYSGYPVSR